MRVALFGLSGNPPTGESGHRGIVKVLVQTHNFDEIWILPVYNHFFTKKLIPFNHRMELCQRNFQDLSQPWCEVKVLPTEAEVCTELAPGVRPGTIDTIEFINNRSPVLLDISLVLGKDTFLDLINKKWKESDRWVNFHVCLVNL